MILVPEPGSPTHVLVVESDNDGGGLHAYLVERLGTGVRRAADPVEAADIVAASPGLEVVVLAAGAGGGDGRALIRRLRAERPEVGVVAHLPEAAPEDLAEEVDELLLGPVDPAYVHELVRELITARAL